MPSSSSPRQLRIPDLVSSCLLKPSTNPYYKEAAAESRAWINSYNVFTDRKRADFIQGQNELLCAYVYHFAGYEQFRTTCDFVNLLFVVDEVSDEQSGEDAYETGQVMVKATKDANWDDGSKLSKITKDFCARFFRLAGPKQMKRWEALCEAYTNCVAKEAELREQGKVLNLESFIPLRRNNSAVLLCFALNEYILGIDLDEEVYQDEAFMEAYWAACDHVCWANDIYSYDLEQSKGQTGNNIVTVLMQENGTSLQETVDFIGVQCNKFMETYYAAREKISPSLGPDAARFIYVLEHWMVGNITWSFDTVRYFGAQRSQVKETGILYLRPPMPVDDKSDSSDEE